MVSQLISVSLCFALYAMPPESGTIVLGLVLHLHDYIVRGFVTLYVAIHLHHQLLITAIASTCNLSG